jgi:hypothetical protein
MIAISGELYQLSYLLLPEVEHLTEEVAPVASQSNVSGIILIEMADRAQHVIRDYPDTYVYVIASREPMMRTT